MKNGGFNGFNGLTNKNGRSICKNWEFIGKNRHLSTKTSDLSI